MSNQKTKQAELFYTPKRLNGDLAVYQYGHHKCPPSHFYGPNKREYYLFHFVVKGKGVYQCGKKKFCLEKGMGFLIKPGEETFYQADDKDPWEYYFVAFHGVIAKSILQEIKWSDGYIFCAENEEVIKRYMKSFCRENEIHAWSEYLVLGQLYMLLAEMIRQQSTYVQMSKENKNKSELESAIMYIKENAMMPDFCIEEIAEQLHMHRSSLYRLFKKNFGISAKQYLQNYRMDLAATLLQFSDLTAKEIAIQVGLPDYPHFHKCFKEHHGYSPLEYRNKFCRK